MQIYNDEKRRIGILYEFRNRAVTTTLESGDKELSFEYPARGDMADLLKEEYYIRTKTDEYVLKSVEKAADFNKYTAVLNVEELEGESFSYGFESKEQTIRACLEFAFEDTQWTVGTCTVTKRRTINIEESATAWDVLQQCLKAYRCECRIESLNKRIHIYGQMGEDRGCYFMEGLNLRKLTLTSDTYEFYTRIIPMGKDGITIEWLHGKPYLENYRYSSKVKTYTWKDERYTNTTSLMEDAEAKLEEMSKPYQAYTADVLDLAKANPQYSNIPDYGIGDRVTLVSKKTRTREKQRIVKITEYPEMPEKNTAELSNATKTFAQMQKTETELAKTEAISIANRTTKKVLGNYSTTEEMETKITASAEKVELGVMHTLESYYDKTETNAVIEISKGEIELSVSRTYQTKDGMNNYSTTQEMRSEIDIAFDGVEIVVTNTLKDYSTTLQMNAAIKIVSDSITAEVTRAINAEESAKASIKLNADNITLKVSKGNVSTSISAESGAVRITSNRMYITSDNFTLSGSGSITAKGNLTSESDDYKSVLSYGNIKFYNQGTLTGQVSAEARAAGGGGTGRVVDIETNQQATILSIGSTYYYALNNGLNTEGRGQRHWFGGTQYFGDTSYMSQLRWSKNTSCYMNHGTLGGEGGIYNYSSFYTEGGLACGGTKYRLVETQNFGTVGMNAMESTGAYFTDVGSGIIDDKGEGYVFFDSVYTETIDMTHDYQVLITGTNERTIGFAKKEKGFFCIHGEAGATFDWMIIAKQIGYEQDYIENVDVQHDEDIVFDESIFYGENNDAAASQFFMDEFRDTAAEDAFMYLEEYEKEVEINV